MMKCCKECGIDLARLSNKPVPAAKLFCSPGCRMAFNNRRRDRGAELYDLFMELRFNRTAAAEANVWTLLCDRASAYRDADKAKREGRRSWQDLREALDAIPPYRSATAGDNR